MLVGLIPLTPSLSPKGRGGKEGTTYDPIELWVYEVADARFEVYRDDGKTYAYERGHYTLTTITWDDAAKTICIDGDDEGLFDRDEAEWLKRIGGSTS